MKKGFFGKLLIKLSCVVLALLCGFACCACKTNEAYGDWQHDEKYHWRYNSKGEIVDKGIHNFLWWQCTLCNYTIAPPEPETPPPDLPEDPDPPVEDDEPEEDEPTYDEPLPEDPWIGDPDEPGDEPTEEPPEEDPPEEEPPADDPEEDPPQEDPPQEEPSEDPPAEDDPEEDPPAEDPPQEEPPQENPPEEQKPEQKPQEPEKKPSTPSTPSTPSKPSKPADPSYENGSDWSDWPETSFGSGDGTGQGGTQGGEGTGGTGGSAGGGTIPVQPNEEAQSDLIFTPIYNAEKEIIAYSVKADLQHNKNKYIEIPDTHKGPETDEAKPVTQIEEKGFTGLQTLETIRLPSQLDRIGYEAFSGSTLKEIYVPDSVTFIDMRAFASCGKLNKVRLPVNKDFTKIEYECFHNCKSLGRIVIPDQVTLITTRAFEYAKLQSLVIGRGLKNIGHQAFNESKITQGILIYDLVKWCQIKIDSQISSPLYWGHRFFLWEDGKAKEIKELVIPEEITELGRFQFGGCTSITKVDMSKVTTVLDEVFIHCTNIKEVILPEKLPEFTANLFYDCQSLEEMVIPEGITQIPYCCFYHCKSLKKLTIPKSVTYIGSLSIDGCESLKEIDYKGTKAEWEKIYIRDEWMWYNGTGNFVIKCEDVEIKKLDDRDRFENPFDRAQREMEEKYGTGYLTARREEDFD